MADSRVRFNSRSEEYRAPTGAVKLGTVQKLKIDISDSVVVRAVRLVVDCDYWSEAAVYEMKFLFHADSYSRYGVEIALGETGLYWYRFEVLTDLGYLTVGRSCGHGVVSSSCGQSIYNSPVVWDPRDDTVEDGIDPPAAWQITVYDRRFGEPEWIYGGVIYQILVDRFSRSERWNEVREEISAANGGAARGRMEIKGKILRDDWGEIPDYMPVNGEILNNDFFGGDLRGIIDKLPYLRELGVSCIYLNPIFEAFSNHKYDTADYEKIDPMFGDEKDFRALCAEADAMGIRIILDGVFAHTGSDSLYFNLYKHYGEGGAYNDPDSQYRCWYNLNGDGTYDSWWGFSTLPKTDKHCHAFQNFIYGPEGVVRKWLRAGASGWRFDVVDEFPAFFTAGMCNAVKDEKPDAITIGEVWEDASSKEAYGERKNYFSGNKLDSVMNYPCRNAVIHFVRGGCGAEFLAETVEGICENYPPEVCNSLMNCLGTHDTVRIMTALAGAELAESSGRRDQAAVTLSSHGRQLGRQLVMLAAAVQMTLPGVPSIYYGDEAGLDGYMDPFNRGCYPWGCEDAELLEYYRSLIAIRRTHDVYKCGEYRTVIAEGGVYAFERYDAGDRENGIVTAANTSEDEFGLSLGGAWRDLISGREYVDTVTVKGKQAVILERK